MFRPNQLVVNLHDGIGGKRKTDASVSIGIRKNGGVNANNLSLHVYERATRVAGIDSGVGLDEGLELAIRNDVAAFVGNDSGGDGSALAKRTPKSEYPVANLHAIGIAQFGGG